MDKYPAYYVANVLKVIEEIKMNNSKAYRICRYLYNMYLQNPDKYYTANEIAKEMPSISCDRRMHSKSRLCDKDVYLLICKGVCDKYADIEIQRNNKPYEYRFSSWR